MHFRDNIDGPDTANGSDSGTSVVMVGEALTASPHAVAPGHVYGHKIVPTS